jgi:anti-sigma factor RsiW
MSETDKFSDEELVAYLDGEAEFAPVDAIKTALITDENLANRLNNLKFDKEALTYSMETIADNVKERKALPDFLSETAVATQKAEITKAENSNTSGFFEGWQKIAAVALLAVAIGWSAKSFSTKNNLQNWHNYVAAYQALYSKETLATIIQNEETSSKQLQHVTGVLGKKIELAQLTNVKGLNYKRAQILGFKGQPLIQLAFLSAKGKPVALCIIKSKNNKTSKVINDVQQGLKAAHWKKGEFEYLLIGSNDAELIKSAATQFSEIL